MTYNVKYYIDGSYPLQYICATYSSVSWRSLMRNVTTFLRTVDGAQVASIALEYLPPETDCLLVG